MRWYITTFIALALLAGVPSSAASGGEEGPPEPVGDDVLGGTGCTNYGIIVQATVLGENRYCEDEPCRNYGVIVFVGETSSCHGSGDSGACIDAFCSFLEVRTGTAEATGDQRSLVPSQEEGPCGVITDPVCWTSAFACRWIWETWHGTVGPIVGDPPCECHDGDPYCEPRQGPGRPPLVIVVVEGEAHP